MYDLIVIGAGPAGMSAAIYACCFKLNHLTIGSMPGGQMILAPDILNYAGFSEISGADLSEKMIGQLKARGGTINTDTVTEIQKVPEGFCVTAADKSYDTKTIILSTGVERRKLNIPGEQEYTGKGVQYCAKCETFDYEKKTVAVVGGANAAAQTAMQLSHAAEKVYLIFRGQELHCDPMWLSQVQATNNIELISNAQIKKITGDGKKVTGVKIVGGDQTERELMVERVYIEIGGVPGTALLIPLGLKLDDKGFIDVDEKLETSISGIFACGDVISHKYSVEQISSAVGLGARAAVSAFSFIKQQNP